VQRFTELRVWQAGRALTREVYLATQRLPKEEKFGLSSQLRRSAVSVIANIAEGSKREHRGDYAHFLNMAQSSLAEVECLLILCGDLQILPDDKQGELLAQADQLARTLSALRRAVLRWPRHSRAPNSQP
jgi:four helix bundle protein